VHTKAKIHNITPKKVHELLNAGNVVIVAGFQGKRRKARLPRWAVGIGLTAIALAARSGDLCQIYTDVDGVYTATADRAGRQEAGGDFLR